MDMISQYKAQQGVLVKRFPSAAQALSRVCTSWRGRTHTVCVAANIVSSDMRTQTSNDNYGNSPARHNPK
eukprot:4806676-Heterocapsa_arctica.AAC.1